MALEWLKDDEPDKNPSQPVKTTKKAGTKVTKGTVAGVFKPNSYQKVWLSERQGADGKFKEVSVWKFADPQIGFKTKKDAENWADAFNVLLELRMQPGAINYIGAKSWAITVEHYGSIYICKQTISKNSHIFGTFCSFDDAENAVKAVGKERIIKAMNTMIGAS